MSGSRDGIVRIYRTSVPNNPPASGVLAEGELSVELADPMRLWVGVSSALDSTGRKLLFDKSTIPTGGPFLPMSGGNLTGPITLAADPLTPQQAATRNYVDNHAPLGGPYLPIGGGALTGALTLSGAPTQPGHAATRAYVDAAPPAGGPYVPVVGGPITGPLVIASATTPLVITDGPQTPVVGGGGGVFLRMLGLPGNAVSVTMDAFSNPTGGTAYITGRNAAGSSAAPTASLTAQLTLGLRAQGYTGTQYATGGAINFSTAEAWSATARGTFINFSTTQIGTSALAERMRLDDSGALLIGLTARAGTSKLQVVGGASLDTLTLGADPTVALGAATKQYVDRMLPLSGGQLTGPLTTGDMKVESLTPPQNNCEVEINGFSGNTINLSGSQNWQGVWGHNRLTGTSTTRINAYQFATNANFNNGTAGHYTLLGNTTVTGGGGGYTGTEGHVNVAAGNGITFIVGTEGSSEANCNVGGASGSAVGYLAGGYSQAVLWPGATFWNHLVGHETDVVMGTGASANDITGHAIIWNCASNGFLGLDCGISFARGGGTGGWNYGISFGAPTETLPFLPTAKLINVYSGGTLDSGFDATQATFTTAFLASKGFKVDGAGHVTSSLVRTGRLDGDDGALVIGRAREKLGFWGHAPIRRPVVNGARGSAAVALSLLVALVSLGLVEDRTT